MIHGPAELTQQLAGIMMSDLITRLEIQNGIIYLGNSVSHYVSFYLDGDEYVVSDIGGPLTVDDLTQLLEKIKVMQEEVDGS